MKRLFEGHEPPVEDVKKIIRREGSEEVETPPTEAEEHFSNQEINHGGLIDLDREKMQLITGMFQLYLAKRGATEQKDIAFRMLLQGENWWQIITRPEMQYAFQKYLTMHKQKDIENMRDMESLRETFYTVYLDYFKPKEAVN